MPRCLAWVELSEVIWGRFPVDLRWCSMFVSLEQWVLSAPWAWAGQGIGAELKRPSTPWARRGCGC